jgi:muramoyltetrapeptide carboxypeptidase
VPGPALNAVRPRALRAGDLVGVCAPSGPVDPQKLRAGVRAVEALGFRVRVPEDLLAREGLTAGSVARRLAEIHGLLSDEEVRGILCARGGSGCIHLLSGLEPALVVAHPKPIVGYSDITFLHLLLDRLGLVSFHGPMVAVDFASGRHDAESFLHALTLPGGAGPGMDDLVALRSGEAQGTLKGGCLSLLAASCGTPFSLRAAGAILLLEDIHEPPYRIDRMLRQLRLSGAFESVRGIVFGDMVGCAGKRDDECSLEEVILDALAGISVPVALGLSTGHTS